MTQGYLSFICLRTDGDNAYDSTLAFCLLAKPPLRTSGKSLRVLILMGSRKAHKWFFFINHASLGSFPMEGGMESITGLALFCCYHVWREDNRSRDTGYACTKDMCYKQVLRTRRDAHEVLHRTVRRTNATTMRASDKAILAIKFHPLTQNWYRLFSDEIFMLYRSYQLRFLDLIPGSGTLLLRTDSRKHYHSLVLYNKITSLGDWENVQKQMNEQFKKQTAQ